MKDRCWSFHGIVEEYLYNDLKLSPTRLCNLNNIPINLKLVLSSAYFDADPGPGPGSAMEKKPDPKLNFLNKGELLNYFSFFAFFMLKLVKQFRDQEIFIIPLFSKVQI